MNSDLPERDPRVPPPTGTRAPRVLSGVSRRQPALIRALEISSRAAGVGFDWPDVTGVRDKIAEELGELDEADGPAEVFHEYGDLLFALVNLGRFLDVVPEDALDAACDRFVRRFEHVEDGLHHGGRVFADATLHEMESLWQQAKERERG